MNSHDESDTDDEKDDWNDDSHGVEADSLEQQDDSITQEVVS